MLVAERALDDFDPNMEFLVYLKPLNAFVRRDSPRISIGHAPFMPGDVGGVGLEQTNSVSNSTAAVAIPALANAAISRSAAFTMNHHQRASSKSETVRKLIEENRLAPPIVSPSLSSSISIDTSDFYWSMSSSGQGSSNVTASGPVDLTGSLQFANQIQEKIAESPTSFVASPSRRISLDTSHGSLTFGSNAQSGLIAARSSSPVSNSDSFLESPSSSASDLLLSSTSSTISLNNNFTSALATNNRNHAGSVAGEAFSSEIPKAEDVSPQRGISPEGSTASIQTQPTSLENSASTPSKNGNSVLTTSMASSGTPGGPNLSAADSSGGNRVASVRLRKAYDNVTVNELWLRGSDIQLAPTTHKDVTLEWDSTPRTVLIIKKKEEPGITEILRAMAEWLKTEKNVNVLVEKNVLQELPELEAFEPEEEVRPKNNTNSGCENASGSQNLENSTNSNFSSNSNAYRSNPDIVICLGGDGTVLHANTLFQNAMPPVMAFGLGSLSFLAPFRIRKYKQSISSVLNQCKVTLRSRLFCIVVTHDKDGKEQVSKRTVLNEVVLDRGYSPYLSNLECFCDHVPITNIQADGIIISSTTGSTAYSLSAGGSICHPQVPAILFTPICPHSLSFRPLIFPDSVELKIQVPNDSRSTAWASFDGREQTELHRGDYLLIRVSKWPFVWIREADGVAEWFKSLAECLHWNDRRKQKPHGIGNLNLISTNSTSTQTASPATPSGSTTEPTTPKG